MLMVSMLLLRLNVMVVLMVLSSLFVIVSLLIVIFLLFLLMVLLLFRLLFSRFVLLFRIVALNVLLLTTMRRRAGKTTFPVLLEYVRIYCDGVPFVPSSSCGIPTIVLPGVLRYCVYCGAPRGAPRGGVPFVLSSSCGVSRWHVRGLG